MYREDKHIELYQPFISDATKKSRSTIIFISFLILSVWFLNLEINNIRLFGVQLTDSNVLKILILTLVVLVFWILIYSINLYRDKCIQAEKKSQLDNRFAEIKIRYEFIINKKEENLDYSYPKDWLEIKEAIAMQSAFSDRTNSLKNMQNFIIWIDSCLPYAMAFVALVLLILGIGSELGNKTYQNINTHSFWGW